MIKKLLLPLCTLSVFSAVAQPTITAASNPGDNDVETRHYATAVVAPGPAGANVTWDFSTAPFSSSAATSTYHACPAATGCSNYPGSTISVTSGNGDYGYYIANSQRLALNGLNASGASVVYTDAEDFLRFPMSYQSSFTDAFYATMTVSSTTMKRGGTVTVTADGWGTLKLPNGDFTNVLRVHMVENYADTLLGMPGFIYTVDNYLWYAPYHHRNLAAITTLTSNPGGTQNYAYYVENFPTAIANTNGPAGNLTLHPNPTTGVFTLTLPQSLQAADANLSVTDITGRSLPVQTTTTGNTATVNADNLPAGMYLLHVRSAAGKQTLKFEKR